MAGKFEKPRGQWAPQPDVQDPAQPPRPAARPAQKGSQNPAQRPAQPNAQRPMQNPAQRPAQPNAQRPVQNPAQRPAQPSAQRPVRKPQSAKTPQQDMDWQDENAFVPPYGRMPQPAPKRSFPFGAVILALVVIALLVALGILGMKIMGMMKGSSAVKPEKPSSGSSSIFSRAEDETTEETEPETTVPVPEHVVSTATIGSMGDLLMHKPVIDTGLQSDGSYNFTSIFKYLTPTLKLNDYNAANLETTLAGTSKPYAGYPMFNAPDGIAQSAQDAGFQMILTANNHCYDTSMQGYSRTLETLRGMNFDTIGTMLTPEDPKYIIKEINGIKVGMLCYTYETSDGTQKYPALNGLPMYDGSYDIINTFRPSAPQKMYDEVAGYLAEMKAQGAEATMMYIHWGIEYILYANDNQKQIAQALCDLGIDVIVGGHPHVVEPMALLESTVDPNHKTVCIYSLGNAVSNQRLGNLSSVSTAHTEDGVLFNVTFEKYSDDTVYLTDVQVIPTWVNLRTNGPREYNILPLVDENRDKWAEEYNLTDLMMSSCEKSYTRTMEIVGEGLDACRSYLSSQKDAREAYYYDLAFFPEKFATQPSAETVPETSETAPSGEAPTAAA